MRGMGFAISFVNVKEAGSVKEGATGNAQQGSRAPWYIQAVLYTKIESGLASLNHTGGCSEVTGASGRVSAAHTCRVEELVCSAYC